MKVFNKILAAFLCIVFIISAIPAYANESKFISYDVQSIDEYGDITESNEAAYYDGENLFVSINFITDYTLYYYDSSSTSFVRRGQEKSGRYGRVQLDLNNKTAVLYMNLNTKKEYNLDNVYKFGSQEFLPLAQMMALLKASLTIKDNKMRIVNSGYTLADADYAMSKMATKLSLANYGINDVIDDIYGGSETAYMASSVLGYFGATVYGLRLSKLDFITKLGDFKEYESFIESCITNNSNYIDALTTNADMVNRFNTAYNLNKDVNDHSKTLKDVTSVIKDVSEPVKDTSMSNALLWVDARDWNAVFDTISSITNVADYYLKFGSMCEDNKNMINQVESRSSVGDNGVPLHLAIESVQKKYGQDLVKSVTAEIGQELADKAANKAKKIVLEKVIPSTAAISIVSKVFKAAGFDIASDSDYSIMIDLNAKNMLFNDYSSLESSLKYQNANQTEKYRLSAIFYLQACEQTFKNAEKLAKKHDLGGNFYKSQIEKADLVLNLYYLAGQSKNFDNFDDIDNIINNNKSEIINSDIINKATTISQDELNNLSGQKTSAKFKSKSFMKKYTENVVSFAHGNLSAATDWGYMRIIDVNRDGYPDLTLSQFSAGGGHGNITNIWLYKNGAFEELKFDDFDCDFLQIATDSKGRKFISNGKPELYNCFNDFYDPCEFGEVVVKNNKLTFKEIYNQDDFKSPDDYINAIEKNYKFKALSDDDMIRLKYDTYEGNDTFVLDSTDDEIKSVVNSYFKSLD